MTTSAQRDEDRFIDADRAAIAERITSTLALWRGNDGKPADDGVTVLTLTRIGAAAVGCSTDDLRDSEIAWIETEARRQLDGAQPEPTPPPARYYVAFHPFGCGIHDREQNDQRVEWFRTGDHESWPATIEAANARRDELNMALDG